MVQYPLVDIKLFGKLRLPYLFHLAKISRQNNGLSFKFQKNFERPLFPNGGFPDCEVLEL